MAGYSGTPLVKKLGIKEDHRVALLRAPESLTQTLGPMPAGVMVHARLAARTVFDVILLFVDRESTLRNNFAKAASRLTPAGGLWICWPKKASGVPTDLTEDRVRAIGLESGLVDNKVCAVDEIWSGLRFVVRLEDRLVK